MARLHSKVPRIALIAALAAAAALTGCGQRGPLYLPDSQPKKRSALEPAPIVAALPAALATAQTPTAAPMPTVAPPPAPLTPG